MIPKYPVSSIKQAGMLSNLKRGAGYLKQYGTRLAKNPVKTLKQNLKSGGTRIDNEKRFDVLENALENVVRNRKKVEFSALGPKKTDGNILSRGVDRLRGSGILAAGRKTHGQVSKKTQQQLIKDMKAKNLLHKHKSGGYSVHRDANVDDLQSVYDSFMQNAKVKKNSVGIVDKIRGATNYVPVPGERGVFLAGAAAGMGGQLMNKETADGRKRGLGERLARAGTVGLAETVAAPLGVANRLYGGLGMAAEQGLVTGTEMLLNRNAAPPKPMAKRAAFVPNNPREILRRISK